MTRLAILGASESPYVQRLLVAAEQHAGVSRVVCLSFPDLASRIGDAFAEELEFEHLLVRTMPIGSLEQVIFRMDCLQRWQDQGVRVVNSPKTLEISIDKWLTLHRLHLADIPVPDTIACQTREDALDAFEQLGRDVVVKPLFGGEGRGLLRVCEYDMAWRVFSNLEQLRSVIYVQRFVPHAGSDIRVLFVGEKVFSVRRVAPAESWRTNVSQGAQVVPYELTQRELALAADAKEAVRGTVVGVDLLPGQDGITRVLEVNAVPGWRGLERALEVDIASEIIDYCCQAQNDA